MSEAMVEVSNVTKVYERGKQKIEVLHHLTLSIPKGDFVALMGPSGSGKTTLLNLIGEVSTSRPPGRSMWVQSASISSRAGISPAGVPTTSASCSSSTTSCRC